MRINQNIASMSTQNSLFKVNREMSKSLEKLSTGLRINSAADDAAGLGVSENLRTQVRGLDQALKNTQDTIAMLTIADGALQEQHEILQRMRELVVQAKNDTYTSTERGYMGQEFTALMGELDRIAAVTNYNGLTIFAAPRQEGFGGRFSTNSTSEPKRVIDQGALWDAADEADHSLFGAGDTSSARYFNMMIGANYSAVDQAAYNDDAVRKSFDPNAANLITIEFGQMNADGLLSGNPSSAAAGDTNNFLTNQGTETAFGWDTSAGMRDRIISAAYTGSATAGTVQTKLDYLIDLIDGGSNLPNSALIGTTTADNITGIERVSRMRSNIGALINRFEHAVNNTMNQINNTQAAESAIRDVDFANETSQYTRSQILTNSATAMLAQANQTTSSVLQLLR